jgi:hypothetical protein
MELSRMNAERRNYIRPKPTGTSSIASGHSPVHSISDGASDFAGSPNSKASLVRQLSIRSNERRIVSDDWHTGKLLPIEMTR